MLKRILSKTPLFIAVLALSYGLVGCGSKVTTQAKTNRSAAAGQVASATPFSLTSINPGLLAEVAGLESQLNAAGIQFMIVNSPSGPVISLNVSQQALDGNWDNQLMIEQNLSSAIGSALASFTSGTVPDRKS